MMKLNCFEFYTFYSQYIQSLNHGFEPIIEDKKVFHEVSNRKRGKRYLFPLTIVILIILDSVIILMRNHFDFKDPKLFCNLFIQNIPKFFQEQGRYMLPVTIIEECILFTFLYFDKMKHSSFLLMPMTCGRLRYPSLNKGL